MKMLHIFILTVSMFVYLNANEALTIHSYQVEVYNARTKYTVNLRERIDQAVYINQSDSVTFSCTATGSSFYVALLRNDKELKRESLHYGQTGNVTLTYTQSDMGCSDAAKFTCRAGSRLELSNITQIIIVKCPDLPPIRFISSNVNRRQYSSLTFQCERHKDVNPGEKFLVSIQSMNGTILNSTNTSNTTQFSFSYLTCEDMDTYSCQTMTRSSNNSKVTDLNVQLCPPIIPYHMETLNAVIGSSLNFTLHTTQLETTSITAFYNNFSVIINKCNSTFCLLEKRTSNKWRREITIIFKNITEEDIGNQIVRLCTQPQDTFICSNLTLVIQQKPLCPTDVSAEVIGTGLLKVTWSYDSPEESFVIFYANSSGQWLSRKLNDLIPEKNSRYTATADGMNTGDYRIKVALTSVRNPETCNNTFIGVNNDILQYDKSIAKPNSNHNPDDNSNLILPIVIACSGVVVLAIVLLAVLLKVKGKHFLKKINGRSDERYKNGNGRGNSQENIVSTNVHQANLEGNATHTTTDNGKTVTLENLTYMTIGNTQVIKKTERTIIEEVRETVEFVNYLNDTDVDEVTQNQMNAEADLQNHTYCNIDLTPV